MPPKLDRCVADAKASLRKRYPNEDEKAITSRAFAICNASLKGGDMEYGYVVKLSDVPTRINALRVSKFIHPVYGEIDITSERLERFAASVNDKVRGVDPDIDYAHKTNDNKAAGWVKAATVEDDKLYLDVEWTPAASEAIKNKEYRYFSPEYADEWTDPEGGAHQDVLFGGALTNRPFMKDLVPLNFDEFYTEKGTRPPLYAYELEPGVNLYLDLTEPFEEDNLTFRDIPQSERKGRPSGDFAGTGTSFPIIKCEDVSAAARSMGRSPQNSATLKRNIISIAKRKGFTRCLPESWKSSNMEEVNELDPKLFSELLGVEEDEDKIVAVVTDLKTFYDTNKSQEEHAKKFEEEFPEEAKALKDLAATNKFNEVTSRLTEWKASGLPPAVEEKFFAVRMDINDTEKFDEAMAELLKTGLVDFSERGGGGDNTDTSAAQKFEDAIQKIMSENDKLDYTEALKKAQSEFPELAKAYVRGGE